MSLFVIILPFIGAIVRYVGLSKFSQIFGNILIIFALVVVSGLVTYTPDWEGYIYWFENDTGRDFLFRRLALIYTNFESFHLTHIIFHATLLTVLSSKLSGRVSGFLIIMYVSIIYLAYTTQIRFFVAYFALFYSFYLFYIEKSKVKSFILCVFSMANHISMIAMIPLFLIIYITKDSLGKFIKLSCVLCIVFVFLFKYTNPGEFIDGYLIAYVASNDVTPSFFGGLFNFGLYFVSSIFLLLVGYYMNKKLVMDNKELKLFHFVLKLATGSMVFLPIAFISQTFGSRFIVTALIFHLIAWAIFFRKTIPIKVVRFIIIFLIWLLLFFHAYYIPNMIGIESISNRSIEVFESNLLFK